MELSRQLTENSVQLLRLPDPETSEVHWLLVSIQLEILAIKVYPSHLFT